MVKILNATDEHVMALGANFSLQADSHLVCMQNEQGYKTQAINIQNQARKGNLPLMLKLLYIYFLFNMCMTTVEALLRPPCLKPCFNSHTNSVFLRSRKWTFP